MTDAIDQLLINALMEDSRRSLKALAQVSGLSAPSVSERPVSYTHLTLPTIYSV